MSEPIRKPSDISKAPTPQNTPSSLANLYLKQQLPTVSTINEEDEKNLTKQLANNPALLSMIQGKLGDLVGHKSGYVENLPKSVKRRVAGLKAVQQQQMKLEAEFQRELFELERKYLKKYEPLFEKRKAVVAGDQEPTAAEIEEGEALVDENEDEREEEEGEEEEGEEEEGEEAERDDIKGIPSFWLTAMENLTCIRETIMERDSEVLQCLKDIKLEYLPMLGFELIFEFNENPFFSNQVLTKTYHYHSELGYAGDFVYDHADGCEINWKSKEANVTINIERRKQRNRNTKQTRTIEKLSPTESFFNFFDPPKPPSPNEDGEYDNEGDDDDEKAELRDRLEFDYQLAEEIKNKLIPRAIDWFTGNAVEYEYGDDEESGDEESLGYGAYDDDDDDDDDDDSGINESGPKENPPDCKQQ